MALQMERLSAENFWTLHNSCRVSYYLGDSVRAEAIIKKQIEKYPDFLTSYSNMGFLHMYQKRFDTAIAYFNRALDAPITNESKQMYCYQ
jgi:Tfp pilus assembly protein PilF